MSRDALEQEIAAADVADWFTFEGQHPVTDIPAYHTMADALFAALNASEDVGLTVPAKITSYLAAGRPCLVSVSGEAARVMDEAAAGLTSPAGDVHGLYENLLALADMPPERRAALAVRAGPITKPISGARRCCGSWRILCFPVKKCNKTFFCRVLLLDTAGAPAQRVTV